MAVYKVPQDVEAEDKLLGPFTFRQFVYLIIVAMAVGVGFVLFKIFPALVVIPLPVIVFFTVLAMPLKKDQSMETYLAALLSFYFLKPRKRLWQPDGIEQLIEITAPRDAEPDRVKHLSQEEASQRLNYLTDIVESRGWAVRGVGVPTHGITSMNQVIYHEAQSAPDLLDNTTQQAQRFNNLIQQRDRESKERAIASMHQTQPQQTIQPPSPYPPQPQPTKKPVLSEKPVYQEPYITEQSQSQYKFDPYPQIHQSIVAPLNEQSVKPEIKNITPPTKNREEAESVKVNTQESTSENAPSPDIIKLANESEGLTVADVAHQAQRLKEKREHPHGLPEDEVEISLH